MTKSISPTRPPRLNPKKLLLSKWTAVQPQAREKHFIVTRLIDPTEAAPGTMPGIAPTPLPIVEVVIEAVHSGRSTTVNWRELTHTTRWTQGWR